MKNKKLHITTIILAGGKSTRMGEDKAMLSLDGISYIDRIVNAALKVSNTILLVSDHIKHQSVKNVSTIKDIYPNKGPLAGLYSGLSYSNTVLNLVLTCDIPMITEEILTVLINNYTTDYQAIITTVNDRKMPLVGMYSKECISTCKAQIMKNDLKMMNFLNQLQSVKNIKIPDLMKDQLLNVNTPQDVARLPISIKVIYFGQIVEITSCTEELISIEKGTVSSLKTHLIQKYPALETASYRIAQNQKITIETDLITGEEIALLPPFAGG